ncbi:MAG TPA: Gfo/Idh/MocA family oxidoreductase [Bryobacteraceae bacterium]|nr:Gfo/Idh/MocA family oxidoreductase [Bryobacteraceae bacterium]
MENGISRRFFFFGGLVAGAARGAASLKAAGYKSPNEKLNIAAIGAGGKGESDIAGCVSENLVAMADPDAKRAAKSFSAHPKAATYKDFRRMLDKEGANIDAVTVSCPDHMHATAAMWAMERGKHVYCQKPLTRTVWEAQQLTAAAAHYGVATQMGNQGYSQPGTRECCEIIWSGEIGDVTEVHAWTDRPGHYWPQNPDVDPKPAPVPETLDWEAWLGDATPRRYSPAYLPFNWRAYPDFGCGAVGDMACHILGAANMSMRLSDPLSVECIKLEGKSKYTYPSQTELVFEFPQRGAMPPLKLYWHDSMKAQPSLPGVPEGELLGDSDINGSLFIGDKGMVTTGCYGEHTRLVPASRMADYKMPPEVLERCPISNNNWVQSHYQDWIRACKGGEPACSNFSVSGPFVQWMLLGTIAMQVEGKLEWDANAKRFTNSEEANALLKPKFRPGWQFT